MAKEWGTNLILMLVEGIKSGYTELKNSVSSIATTIEDYL